MERRCEEAAGGCGWLRRPDDNGNESACLPYSGSSGLMSEEKKASGETQIAKAVSDICFGG